MRNILLGLVIILGIATFYPSVTKQEALNYLNSTDWIARQHIDNKASEEDVALFFPIPFGSVISTYEGMWFVPFWKK